MTCDSEVWDLFKSKRRKLPGTKKEAVKQLKRIRSIEIRKNIGKHRGKTIDLVRTHKKNELVKIPEKWYWKGYVQKKTRERKTKEKLE